ncbi:MAG: hypothetical protein ACLQIB_58735 [Isosphaeraceae bacterium]
MSFLERALRTIPEAAANPFTILAYALAVGAWLSLTHRNAQLNRLKDQAKNLTKTDFTALIRWQEGTSLPTNIDPILALCFVLFTLAAIAGRYAVRSQFRWS